MRLSLSFSKESPFCQHISLAKAYMVLQQTDLAMAELEQARKLVRVNADMTKVKRVLTLGLL